MFEDDAIPRPSWDPRKSKSQRSSASSPATFGSSKNRETELMQEQILLDREAKKESINHELAASLAVCEIQNEDLKILTFDTTGMNPKDATKIEALKDKTRAAWVKAKRQEVSGSKNEMIYELGEINKVMDRGEFDDATVFCRFELKRKLLNVTEMEAKDRFQKSKVKWAVEGDENSKIFHGIINKRRSQLAIPRFKEPVKHRFKLNSQFHKKLLQSQVDDLEKGVSRDEIRRAVWSCGDNKSPGPDGYTFEILKKYWDLIGSDFCDAVIDAKFVNDFRPISLIGSVYKVVTKVLANRLASVIVDLIFDTQSAFVAGRQMLDGPFILDEILHWCKRKKKQAMFFKVDFAKAYDSASILIPSKEFSCYRGLKQGDPLAPYLFILIMESLHLSFSRMVDEGLFKGVSSFFALNRALLLKWVWRFVSQDGSLWYQVIRAIYGPSVGTHSTHLSSNWCSIVREVHKLKGKGFDFWSHCKKRIGNGNDTRFWFDCWIGDIPLRDKFSRLFALKLDKKASVAVKLNAPIEISFRRNARGGLEQHLMADMNSMLDSVVLLNSGDRWVCDLASDDNFQVKEVRNFIDDLFLPRQAVPTRWVKYIPIKVNIFAWRARQGFLPTRVNLVRRGINIESSTCPICSSCEEDVNHIFFRCDLAEHVLRRIFRWWGLDPNGWTSFQEWQAWLLSIQFSSK
nr:RNA-directed DNA polymerase, eukaryota [Tanacetum cinerariifolium]